MKINVSLPLACVAVLSLSSCRHESPNFVYMPDMAYSPAIKAQEVGSMRMPPKGTVPREAGPLQTMATEEESGKSIQNPLRRTKTTLQHGKEMYRVYCSVCHGVAGLGNGPVVPRFPPPPSLVSEQVRGYPDGRIFHIITNGRNLMPSYASQVLEEDRWAIIHFIRALYRSQNPSADDLKRAEQW